MFNVHVWEYISHAEQRRIISKVDKRELVQNKYNSFSNIQKEHNFWFPFV